MPDFFTIETEAGVEILTVETPGGHQGPVGPAGIVFRGAWASGVNYVIRDAVTHLGSLWYATAANIENEPPAAPWQMLASKGDDVDMTTHLEDAEAAHEASAVAVSPVGGIAATNVQEALQGLDTAKADDHAHPYEVTGTAATAVAAHEADTTNVHGIPDTAALETQTGAQAKADAAESDAVAHTNAHAAETTTVHGISDASALVYTDDARLHGTHDIAGVDGLQAALDAKIPLAQKGAANGVAPLDGTAKIDPSFLPPMRITDVHTVADIAARDALVVDEGDVALVDPTGAAEWYIYDGTVWVPLATPPEELTAAEILALLVTVDGTGSGLDADLVDGYQAAALLDRANHTGTQAIGTVAGLQAALDAKADDTELHSTHAIGDVTGLQGALDAKTDDSLISASGFGFVSHGADNTMARPVGFAAVMWKGSVLPDNIQPQDIWGQTT